MSRERDCPVDGCGVAISPGHLMCRNHWRRVPRQMAADVNDTWAALRRLRAARDHDGYLEQLPRYRAAAAAAIDAVNSKQQEASRCPGLPL